MNIKRGSMFPKGRPDATTGAALIDYKTSLGGALFEVARKHVLKKHPRRHWIPRGGMHLGRPYLVWRDRFWWLDF